LTFLFLYIVIKNVFNHINKKELNKMLHQLNHQNIPFVDPGQVIQVRQLSNSQFDGRNVDGLRFVEISAGFTDFNEAPNAKPYTALIDISDIVADFSYNQASSFRVVNISLDTYSITHRNYVPPNPPNQPEVLGFDESIRENIALRVPFLELPTKARYSALLPSDFNTYQQGITYSTQYLPNILSVEVGILNPDSSDRNLYNFNSNRLVNDGVPAPNFSSQYIRSINIRLALRANYEFNQIPFNGMNNNFSLGNAGRSGLGLNYSGTGQNINSQSQGGGGTSGNKSTNDKALFDAIRSMNPLQAISDATNALSQEISNLGASGVLVESNANIAPQNYAGSVVPPSLGMGSVVPESYAPLTVPLNLDSSSSSQVFEPIPASVASDIAFSPTERPGRTSTIDSNIKFHRSKTVGRSPTRTTTQPKKQQGISSPVKTTTQPSEVRRGRGRPRKAN
jgi:hypothetical protein